MSRLSKTTNHLLLAPLAVVALAISSCDHKPRPDGAPPSADHPQPTEAALLTLSKEHPPVVVLAPDALPTEEFAAQELADYLHKILQLEVPVLKTAHEKGDNTVPIYVGYHPENARLTQQKLDIEEAVYSVEEKAVHIVGGRSEEKNSADPKLPLHDRGTLYAVYDFLESLGVRWFRPEAWGEHVPTQEKITLSPGEHRSKPAFKYRYGINHYQTYAPLDKQLKDPKERELVEGERQMARLWAVRNRQNCNLWSDPKLGGYFHVNFAHAYRDLVPPQKYFATHPEFFALVNGKRSSDPNAQLCLSNPEVENLVFQSILKKFEASPDLEIASLDPNDYGIWCECEGCRAMDDPALRAGHSSSDPSPLIAGVSMSNRVVAFNNRIAKRLHEVLPGKKVGWYAYYLHTEVPTKVEHLEQNTAVMVVAFAGSFSDYSRGLYDPKSPQNARFLKILEGYHKLTQESGAPLLAHDYWSGYAWQGPLPVVHSMQDKLRAYHRDFGLAGIYNEVHPAWGSQGMALYFYTWLLRHPEGDLESEKDYYYKSFYGPAGESMRQYHETLENAAWGGPYFGSGGSEIEPLFSNKLLDTLEPFLKEAQEKVAGDETLEKRLQGDVAGWTYARKVRNFYDALGRRDLDGARKELGSLVAYFYQFPDGSVFDNRKSVRGSMDNIFNKYRKLVEREGRLLTFFEEPKVLRTYIDQWSFQTDPKQEGEKAGWEAASFDDKDWKKLKAREPWQAQGFGSYQGTAWYRKSFTVPKFEPGKRLILYFGAVDGDATVYLNGKKIGEHLLDPKTGKGHDEPFFFDVTDILKPGDTVTAAIKVVKTEYVGGLTAPVLLLQAKSIRPPE